MHLGAVLRPAHGRLGGRARCQLARDRWHAHAYKLEPSPLALQRPLGRHAGLQAAVSKRTGDPEHMVEESRHVRAAIAAAHLLHEEPGGLLDRERHLGLPREEL